MSTVCLGFGVALGVLACRAVLLLRLVEADHEQSIVVLPYWVDPGGHLQDQISGAQEPFGAIVPPESVIETV